MEIVVFFDPLCALPRPRLLFPPHHHLFYLLPPLRQLPHLLPPLKQLTHLLPPLRQLFHLLQRKKGGKLVSTTVFFVWLNCVLFSIGKENVSTNANKGKQNGKAKANPRVQKKKNQAILLISQHGGVRPPTPNSQQSPVLNPTSPPPPLNDDNSTAYSLSPNLDSIVSTSQNSVVTGVQLSPTPPPLSRSSSALSISYYSISPMGQCKTRTLDWTVGLDCWTGLLDWTVGLDSV